MITGIAFDENNDIWICGTSPDQIYQRLNGVWQTGIAGPMDRPRSLVYRSMKTTIFGFVVLLQIECYQRLNGVWQTGIITGQDSIRGIAFEPPALAVPDDPAAPTVTALNSSSIQAVGVAPDANPAITSYDWQYRVVGTSPWTDVLDQTNLTQTFTSLDPSRNYEVQFRATNSVGDSGYSDSNSAQTSNVVPTVSINTLTQTVDGGTVIAITANSSDAGGGSIASYRWTQDGTEIATSEDTNWTAPAGTTVDQPYVLRLTVTDDEGATAFDTVTITVRAVLVIPSFTDNTGDSQAWSNGTAISNIVVPEASGMPAPTYAVVGALPTGIQFNTTTRTISGTPTVDGSGTIRIRATNSQGIADWTLAYTTSAAIVIPAPTLLQPSNTQVGAIGTTTEYFVTFQYDDNSSFTSPSTVYDTVKSSSHSASWTPPSGFTYIRARFTTLIS